MYLLGLIVCQVLRPLLCYLHALSHLVFPVVLGSRYYYFPILQMKM